MLTCVELSGLLMVILVGMFAIAQGKADFSRVVMFDTAEDKSIFIAVTAGTSLAFFAMVGFEDSVNMAEEIKDPEKIFPKIMLTGLGITGMIYILVSITAIALVPPGELGEGEAPLTKVVAAGAPNLPIGDIFPLIAMFAVANSALINMLMASRLLYGMAKQQVLPPVLGRVLEGRRTPWVAILFTTVLAVGLLICVYAAARSARWAARRRCCCWRCSPWSTSAAWCCARTRSSTSTSRAHRAADPRARCSAPIWSGRGPAGPRCSTRSPASCSPSASCCGDHLVGQPGHLQPQDLRKDPEELDSDGDFKT